MSDFGLFRVSFISDFDSSVGEDIAVYHQIAFEYEEATPRQFPCYDVDDDCTSIEQQIHDHEDDDDDSSLIDFYASTSREYRLSLTGMTNSCGDELYSERYSSPLDGLRSQLLECLPQTESMVSRSIIRAFSSDCTQATRSDSSSLDTSSCKKIADLVQEAREWVVLQLDSADSEQYLQEQMDEVFVRVRNQEISTDDASQIVFGIASVLRMEFVKPAPVNCSNLGPRSTDENKENERENITTSSSHSLPKENTGGPPHILGESLVRFQEPYSKLGPLKQKLSLEFAGYVSTTNTTKKQQFNPWPFRRHRRNALRSSE
jgi:hypothetical protein